MVNFYFFFQNENIKIVHIGFRALGRDSNMNIPVFNNNVYITVTTSNKTFRPDNVHDVE